MTTKAIQGRVQDDAQVLSELREMRRCLRCGEIMFAIPVLRCSHCGTVMRIHCFAYKSGGNYYAECLDFNLISRGATEEEAVGRLQQTMFTYLKTAFEGDTKGLVPRRAPLSHWLRYYGYRIIELIRHRLLKGHLRHKDFQGAKVYTVSHC